MLVKQGSDEQREKSSSTVSRVLIDLGSRGTCMKYSRLLTVIQVPKGQTSGKASPEMFNWRSFEMLFYTCTFPWIYTCFGETNLI